MVHLLLPPEVFYNQLISDKMDMQDHYLARCQSHNNDHRSPAGMGPFSFCSFPFLLNAKAKTRLLQVRVATVAVDLPCVASNQCICISTAHCPGAQHGCT